MPNLITVRAGCRGPRIAVQVYTAELKGDMMTKKAGNLAKLAESEKKQAEERAENRLSVFDEAGPAAGADWGEGDPEWIQSVVVAITSMGGAVTFGMSRDQDAHSVTLLLDKTRKTFWIGPADGLNERLELICATLDTLA